MEPDTAVTVYSEIALPALSILQTLILLAILLPAAALLGWRLGHLRRRRRLAAGREIDMVVGETTLGAILAIFGLLLAFSFGHALSQFETRKAGLTDEAAALGTAFLRADLLDEPGRTDLQEALLTYAETRLPAAGARTSSQGDVTAFLDRTLRAQAALWPLTVEATAPPIPPATRSLVAAAVNEVIDMHLYRLAALTEPISAYAYGMMLATALAALFLLGDRAGMLGRALTWRTFVLSAFLTVVMITIVDLQRAGSGVIRIDETPLRATIYDMRAALAAR